MKRYAIALPTLSVIGLSILSIAAIQPAHAQYMYVGDYLGHQVLRFDDHTGAPDPGNPFITTIGNTESIRGYNGILLVADGDSTTNRVTKHDIHTGAQLAGPNSQFTINTALYDMAISPDASRVYIAEQASIAAYDLSSGALLSSHSTPDSWGVAISPSGEIFTGNGWSTGAAGIFKYDAGLSTQTQVVAAGDHGLTAVAGVTFARDGSFYAVNGGNFDPNNGFINHYKADGTFIDTLTAPSGVLARAFAAAIGPDGDLYVTSFAGACVVKFDTTTDTFDGAFVPPHGGGVVAPKTLAFDVNNVTTVPEPGSIALIASFAIFGAGFARKRRK